jgi:AGCS family alanine or glycine:cation symporter
VVRFREALRALVPAAEAGAPGARSPFQAFMTALAATIGTGNIAGVATAVVSGGPGAGAVFWIWCYGSFATAIKFTEAVLGIRYRSLSKERLSAGPMHYLRDGMGLPRLGWVYALVAGVAALTTTPFTQPNSMADVLRSQLGIPTWIYCGLVVFGAVGKVDTIWAWGDLMNGLQVFPNLVGLIGLSGVAAAMLRGPDSKGPARAGA